MTLVKTIEIRLTIVDAMFIVFCWLCWQQS